MINKLLNYKILLLLVGLLILVFGFYWFQYRPSEIRKECSQVTEKFIDEKISGKDINTSDSISAIKLINEKCLNSKGIK